MPGQIEPDERARAEQFQRDQRARLANGQRLARALNGSRAAREALATRMGAVTRTNDASDRRNRG